MRLFSRLFPYEEMEAVNRELVEQIETHKSILDEGRYSGYPSEYYVMIVHGDYNSNARALYPRLYMGVKIEGIFIIIEAQINYYDIGEDLRRDKAVIDLIDKDLLAIGYRTLFNIIDNYLSHII